MTQDSIRFIQETFDSYHALVSEYLRAFAEKRIASHLYDDFLSDNLDCLGEAYKDLLDALTKYQNTHDELALSLSNLQKQNKGVPSAN